MAEKVYGIWYDKTEQWHWEGGPTGALFRTANRGLAEAYLVNGWLIDGHTVEIIGKDGRPDRPCTCMHWPCICPVEKARRPGREGIEVPKFRPWQFYHGRRPRCAMCKDSGWVSCVSCHLDPAVNTHAECQSCDGTGKLRCGCQIAPDVPGWSMWQCPDCGYHLFYAGETFDGPCPSCSDKEPEKDETEADQLPAAHPCPFCGSGSLDMDVRKIGTGTIINTYCVKCLLCHARGPKAGSRRSALELWNRRKPPWPEPPPPDDWISVTDALPAHDRTVHVVAKGEEPPTIWLSRYRNGKWDFGPSVFTHWRPIKEQKPPP